MKAWRRSRRVSRPGIERWPERLSLPSRKNHVGFDVEDGLRDLSLEA
jgi:hypothetical protein